MHLTPFLAQNQPKYFHPISKTKVFVRSPSDKTFICSNQLLAELLMVPSFEDYLTSYVLNFTIPGRSVPIYIHFLSNGF